MFSFVKNLLKWREEGGGRREEEEEEDLSGQSCLKLAKSWSEVCQKLVKVGHGA